MGAKTVANYGFYTLLFLWRQMSLPNYVCLRLVHVGWAASCTWSNVPHSTHISTEKAAWASPKCPQLTCSSGPSPSRTSSSDDGETAGHCSAMEEIGPDDSTIFTSTLSLSLPYSLIRYSWQSTRVDPAQDPCTLFSPKDRLEWITHCSYSLPIVVAATPYG